MLSWLEKDDFDTQASKKLKNFMQRKYNQIFPVNNHSCGQCSYIRKQKSQKQNKILSSQLFWLCDYVIVSVTKTSNKESQRERSWRLKFTADG